MTTSEMAGLPDDPELVQEGYLWEKNHPDLFAGKPDAEAAVFFSRSTRDYYGQCHEDYAGDYVSTCNALMKYGVDFEVVTAIPDSGQWRILILSSVICLSLEERKRLNDFLQKGGIAIAAGPIGLRDDQAGLLAKAWLEDLGICIKLIEPKHAPGFPPYKANGKTPPPCSGYYHNKYLHGIEWISIAIGAGRLLWSPARASIPQGALSLINKIKSNLRVNDLTVDQIPRGWRLRRFRDGKRVLFFGLPAKVKPIFHGTLKNQITNQRIIEKLYYKKLSTSSFAVRFKKPPGHIKVYSPDLSKPRVIGFKKNEPVREKPFYINLAGISRFFIVEIEIK